MNPINISTSNALLKWQPAAVLLVSGADAATFLQGQFTNDLRSLGAGESAYGLWLTVKGKVLADSFVVRGELSEGFWVVSYFSPATVIRERLEAFVIADDVVIEDRTADFVGITVIEADAPTTRHRPADATISFPGRRVRRTHTEYLLLRGADVGGSTQFTGFMELDPATAETLRIADGIPAVPADVGPGDLPNEGGLEAEAISFTKGCYLGQEVMARLKSMGQVRRKLLRVQLETSERPIERAPLLFGDRAVGEVRSVARHPSGDGFIGLAMVSLLQAGSNRRFTLTPGATPNVSLLDTP